MNVLKNIDLNISKKIFSSKDNVGYYLIELNKIKNINLNFREITKGKIKENRF